MIEILPVSVLLSRLQVLFQSSWHGHPQDDTKTNFFADSKCPILGLSNEVSFVPEILWKDG